MTRTFAIILAVITGSFIATQPTINGSLGKVISPRIAALHSILISVTVVAILNIFSGDLSNYANIFKVHPLYWIRRRIHGSGNCAFIEHLGLLGTTVFANT